MTDKTTPAMVMGAEGLAKAGLRIITTELEEVTDHTLAEVM